MAEDVGRPTELNEELLLKIKGFILQSKTIKDISEILDIPYKTMEGWSTRNYEGFADKLLSYKHERMLATAEIKLEQHMHSEDEKVSLDASKFVGETLGKSKGFSKRSELSGPDGATLELGVVILPKRNENPLDTTAETGTSTS